MRTALISDIHGNLLSLEAVLADMEREQVDQVVFLGDLATLGPQPCEVVARIKSLNCPCIMGNHDTYLIDPSLLRTYTDEPWFLDTIDWCIQQLSDDDLAFISTFQPTLKVPLDWGDHRANSLRCFHGSPKIQRGHHPLYHTGGGD